MVLQGYESAVLFHRRSQSKSTQSAFLQGINTRRLQKGSRQPADHDVTGQRPANTASLSRPVTSSNAANCSNLEFGRFRVHRYVMKLRLCARG